MIEDLNIYWKKVVDTIQDGIMIVDSGGTIVSVNRGMERITGFSRDELLGHSCAMLHCDIFDYARAHKGNRYCVLFRNGSLDERKCTLRRKSGRRIHVLKNASLLYDAQGHAIGAVETVTDITELIEKDHQIEVFRRELQSRDGFHGIMGQSAVMLQMYDHMTNAAQSDAPVIILGESGTGKELVAQVIHELGPRKTKPFVKFNCAALNETLLESELFGHVKGAYTGAYRNRIGRFEAAKQGDIFLDEIGDLPLSTQVKLLRVLEERVVERVGDNQPVPVDVRIISATNKDLEALVKQGLFREDFYYRINVIPILVPPLRKRASDIPILAQAFFRQISLKSDRRIDGISSQAMARLMEYPWPGNVRELKSALEYAFVTCHESLIEPRHLPPAMAAAKPAAPITPQARPVSRDERQKQELMEALAQAGGNQSEAARLLGISRVTVWNRMKKFAIKPQWVAGDEAEKVL
ncbi:MAG: sigma 54-interacting transcriptional regulator [Desulfatibacillaceae bacterium]|nr:sigma 54-interacting transcriptional regulator [Desulfatibacillaceae bacterium]